MSWRRTMTTLCRGDRPTRRSGSWAATSLSCLARRDILPASSIRRKSIAATSGPTSCLPTTQTIGFLARRRIREAGGRIGRRGNRNTVGRGGLRRRARGAIGIERWLRRRGATFPNRSLEERIFRRARIGRCLRIEVRREDSCVKMEAILSGSLSCKPVVASILLWRTQ
jgi:hypothetical protein